MTRFFVLLGLATLLLGCATTGTAQRGGKRPQDPDLGLSTKPADYGIRSKKALKLYAEGRLQQTYGRYRDALRYYQEALLIEPWFGMAHFGFGECRYLMNRQQNKPITDSYRPFAVADSLHPDGRDDMWNVYFYLAEHATQQQQYLQAEAYLKKFLSGRPQITAPEYRERAELMLPSARFAADAVRNPVPFRPKNLGENINSPGDDYMAYLTADDGLLFFTSRREGTTGGFDPLSQNFPEDFYLSTQQNGTWAPAENLGPPVNTGKNEGASCISPDGQFVFFTACGRRGGWGNCDLYVARLNGTQWGEPQNLGPNVNSKFWESHPNLSNDGRTLFFASAREGGLGGVDLWYCTLTDTGWSPPTNMGPTINTPGNEYGPFLHADDYTFYFASDGHLGFGGQDLFMTTRAKNGGWEKPTNLGYPINTPGGEAVLFVNAAGTLGIFSSNHLEGYGGNDLFAFELDESIRPKRRATFVRGVVLDSVTRKPISAEVTLVQLVSSDTTRRVRSNTATGKFLTSLPLGQDYAAFVDATGYLFHSQTFTLEAAPSETFFDLTIALQPIETGATVVLQNIFFAYDSDAILPESEAELNNAVRFLTNNPTVRVEIAGHTDDVGSDAYNLELSRKRAASVRSYLISQGIAADRLTANGYGETQPLQPNDSDTNRALNRRTAFTILQK